MLNSSRNKAAFYKWMCFSQKRKFRLYWKSIKRSSPTLYSWFTVNNPEFLTQLTLDVSAVLEIEQCDQENWGLLKLQTREYINKIHHKRLTELKRLSIFWAKWDSEHHSNVWWKKNNKKKKNISPVYIELTHTSSYIVRRFSEKSAEEIYSTTTTTMTNPRHLYFV